MMVITDADGTGIGMKRYTPGLIGSINTVTRCIMKSSGCTVVTRCQSVPHPNAHATEEVQKL